MLENFSSLIGKFDIIKKEANLHSNFRQNLHKYGRYRCLSFLFKFN